MPRYLKEAYAYKIERHNPINNTWVPVTAREVGSEDSIPLTSAGISIYHRVGMPFVDDIPDLHKAEITLDSFTMYDIGGGDILEGRTYTLFHGAGGIEPTQKSALIRYSLAIEIVQDGTVVTNENSDKFYLMVNAGFPGTAYHQGMSTTAVTNTTSEVAIAFYFPAMLANVTEGVFQRLKSMLMNAQLWEIKIIEPSGRMHMANPLSVDVSNPVRDEGGDYGYAKALTILRYLGSFRMSGDYYVNITLRQNEAMEMDLPFSIVINASIAYEIGMTAPIIVSVDTSLVLELSITEPEG